MTNKKCPSCGFNNLGWHETCRHCQQSLESATAPYEISAGSPTPYANQYQSRPAKGGPSPLKILFCIFAGLFGLSVLGTSAGMLLKARTEVNWREFHAPGTKVVVMMPSEPSPMDPIVTPMMAGSMTNRSFSGMIRGQGSYIFCVIEYSFDFNASEDLQQKMIDAELESLVKRTNSTLLKKENLNVNGYRGVQFEMNPPIDLSRESGKSVGRMFLADKRLYLLSLTANTESELFKRRDLFLNVSVPAS
jgi:hypothetical protein